MYFTVLPNHKDPSFNEQAHFAAFDKHNIVFNAKVHSSFCEDHVGLLSLKMVFSGEEEYFVNRVKYVVRKNNFLLLNKDQNYSSSIKSDKPVDSFSIFFKPDFARSVLADIALKDKQLLDDPFCTTGNINFFQKLYEPDPVLQQSISRLLMRLKEEGASSFLIDEELCFVLLELLRVQRHELRVARRIDALKPATRSEIYRRLCVAKDVMQSGFQERLQLDEVSRHSLLSVPQLVRQFKAVFGLTPHQYLTGLRMEHAAGLLARRNGTVTDVAWECGMEDASAFCRLFRKRYNCSPEVYRRGMLQN